MQPFEIKAGDSARLYRSENDSLKNVQNSRTIQLNSALQPITIV